MDFNMLELIAKFGLLFSNPSVYAVIILIGFIYKNENIFGRTLFILLFTMIYNVWLKSIWQIPLPEHLNGWAFPSGHMHAATVFWGWLAIEYRRVWFSCFVAFILPLAAFGMIYHNYHNLTDILGAVGFGSVSILLYWLINKKPYFSQKPYRLGYLLIALSSIIMLIPTYSLLPHVWQAWGVLVGFTLGWHLLSLKSPTTLSTLQKIITLAIALAGAVAFIELIKQLSLDRNITILTQFLLVGFWVSYSKGILPRTQKS